jgi:hypothetical protein
MFAFDRSAFAVLAPLALLVVAAWWANREPAAVQPTLANEDVETVVRNADQTVAANLPSR